MPCYLVSLTNIQLDKNTDADLLFKALETMGLNPVRKGNIIHFGSGETYNVKTGEMQAQAGRNITEIKKAMGGEGIKAKASKFNRRFSMTAPKNKRTRMTRRPARACLAADKIDRGLPKARDTIKK